MSDENNLGNTEFGVEDNFEINETRRTRMGKIGVYSQKTRKLQRSLSFEAYGLSHKEALFYLYLGDRDSDNPDINKFENKTFFEVPDRVYASEPIGVPVGMEQYSDYKTDFSRFGLINPMTDEVRFTMHIDDFDTLGRQIVIGDVFEMPFFENERTDDKKAFYEVTDVDMKVAAEKFICVFHAVTLDATRSTIDIPFNNDNFNLIEDVMSEADVHIGGIVITDEPEFDYEEEPVKKDDVDYRRKNQSSFLDDPFKEI